MEEDDARSSDVTSRESSGARCPVSRLLPDVKTRQHDDVTVRLDLVDQPVGEAVQERAPHDKRSTRIKLSEKGLALCQKIDELYKRNVEALSKEMDTNSLNSLNTTLNQLERFWTDYINNIYKVK